MSDVTAYLGFSQFYGIGPMRFDGLVKQFGTVSLAYNASLDELTPFIGSLLAAKFVDFRKNFNAEKVVEAMKQKQITLVTREHQNYPAPLKNIADPPICLYVKGDIGQYDFVKDRYFAVVGTRKPTSYGAHIARQFSYELAMAGFIIVSGMAMGIDGMAHEAAISAGCRTIAFLGCGVDIIYPYANRGIYKRILETGGLVVSEFPPGMTVRPGLFVSRNRLISGLCCGTLVAEGQRDSGSLITARCALEQGRDVFAVPAPITSDQSQAPNLLLKEGATLVTCVKDIFEALNLSYRYEMGKKELPPLSPEQTHIIELLSQEPHTADALGKALRISISEVLRELSALELEEVVAKDATGSYRLV